MSTDKRKLGLEPGSNRALRPTLWAPKSQGIHMFANYKVNNSTLKNDYYPCCDRKFPIFILTIFCKKFIRKLKR